MSNSGNVLKQSFIQFTNANTRVIDPNVLVAKRLEGFTGVLRERTDEEQDISSDDEVSYGSIDALTEDTSEVYEQEGPSIEETQAECDRILEEARAEAAKLVADATAQADSIRNSATAEGFQAGKEAALKELKASQEELEGERTRLELDYKDLIRELEPKMVEVITDVYNHVFGENFFSRRDVMVCLINKALLHVETTDQVIIHVCPEDYDMLIGMKGSLLEKTALQSEPEIIQRDDFDKGQAKIETPFGIIDCSIDTELKELTRTLKLLSYKGQPEA